MAQELAPGLFWISTCQDADDPHAHLSAYLIQGERSCLVDTGGPTNRERILAEVEELLGPRPLDYVFVTHAEVPHMANLDPLRDRYPDLRLLGGNPSFIFPRFSGEGRHERIKPGDWVDLGGRRVEFVMPAIMDLPNSLWAYDEQSKTLFAVDGWAYPHEEGPDCTLLAEAQARTPRVEDLVGFYRALFPWLRFMRPEALHDEVDRVFQRDIRIVAPAHGKVSREPEWYARLLKDAISELTRG